MPQNRYICYKCEKEWAHIGPHKDRPCPTCAEVCTPELPKALEEPTVLETVDKQFNTKWKKDFQERAKKRNAFYTKKTAVERAREHGDDPKKHGITEDDPRPV